MDFFLAIEFNNFLAKDKLKLIQFTLDFFAFPAMVDRCVGIHCQKNLDTAEIDLCRLFNAHGAVDKFCIPVACEYVMVTNDGKP